MKKVFPQTNVALVSFFLRGLGFFWLWVVLDTSLQYFPLLGEEGILPLNGFARLVLEQEGFWGVFRHPSLFWVSGSDVFSGLLLGLAFLAAGLVIQGKWRTVALAFLWLWWLSVVNFGGDFFVYIWDSFLLETTLLSICLSYLADKPQGRRLTVLALKLLLFRLWFSMGMVKLCYNNQSWLDFDFMGYFYPNQPMPAPGAWFMWAMPTWMHGLAAILVLVVEVVGSWFIWFKATRKVAFWVFALASLLIQFSGNYAWFNLLTIWLGILLWYDPADDLSQVRDAIRWPRRFISLQMALQVLLLIALFFPAGNRFLNFLNHPGSQLEEQENPVLKTLGKGWATTGAFHLADPYGVFKGIAYRRWEIYFEASEDGRHWEPYVFRRKSGPNLYLSYFAPHFPRLDQQFFYEAQQGSFYLIQSLNRVYSNETCWTKRLLEELFKGNDPGKWFANRPLEGRIPRQIRMQLIELSFKKEGAGFWRSIPVANRTFVADQDLNACPLVPDEWFEQYKKHQQPGSTHD